jgi:hypothetical protein
MLSRPKVSRRNRRQFDPSNVPHGTYVDAIVTIASGKARLTFSNPISMTCIFRMTVMTVAPTAATLVNSNTVDLTYATPPVAGNAYVIPDHDPAIRTRNGGFVF